MRPEVNSNRFEISLWGKISVWCEVTSLWLGRSETHFGANFPSVKLTLIKWYMCNRALLLFGKSRQWNFHVNCHVNKTRFQSGLRFQTGLSSLRVSCKLALINMLFTLWVKLNEKKTSYKLTGGLCNVLITSRYIIKAILVKLHC